MKKSATAEVQVKSPDGAEKSTAELVQHDFGAKPTGNPKAYVEVELGTTEPTKAYANVRIGVKLGLWVEPSEIEEAYDFALSWADAKVEAVLKDVREQSE